MKWGIRRYPNLDGSYIEAVKTIYAREVQKNHQKSKKNRIDDDDLKDPNKWVKDDLTNTKGVLDAAKSTTNELKNLERATRSKKENPRLDLSNMSDEELRKQINRELLERQYNDVFNKAETSKGREYVSQILDTAVSAIGVTGSIAGLMVAIQTLRKG